MARYELVIELPDGETERVLLEAADADDAVDRWWRQRKAEVGGNAAVQRVRLVERDP